LQPLAHVVAVALFVISGLFGVIAVTVAIAARAIIDGSASVVRTVGGQLVGPRLGSFLATGEQREREGGEQGQSGEPA
jgi:hypothetical protein